jgi:hypothetical protein
MSKTYNLTRKFTVLEYIANESMNAVQKHKCIAITTSSVCMQVKHGRYILGATCTKSPTWKPGGKEASFLNNFQAPAGKILIWSTLCVQA